MELIRWDIVEAIRWRPPFPEWEFYSLPVILPPHKF